MQYFYKVKEIWKVNTNYCLTEFIKALTTCFKFASTLLYNGQIILCSAVSLTRPEQFQPYSFVATSYL